MISIIVPVYNVEAYIIRCLDSIRKQTFTEFEVIIVDDGSKDDSIRKTEQFIKDNPWLDIRLIHHKVNSGLLAARRTGYLNAKGEYIVFLDSDDFLTDTALQVLSDGINATGADIFIAAHNIVNSDNLSVPRLNKTTGDFNSTEILKLLLSGSQSHSMWGRIFRSGLFNPSESLPDIAGQINSEDLMLFYTLVLRAEKIHVSNIPVYNYFYNIASSSKKKFSESQFRQIVRATNYLYSLLRSSEEWSNVKDLLKKYIVNRIFSILAQGCPQGAYDSLDSDVKELMKERSILSSLPVHRRLALAFLREFPVLRKITSLHYS